MKNVILIGLSLTFGLPQMASAWGFWAHRRINRMAVFTLPPELLLFYKQHIDYLEEHAVDPDKRRYAVVGEAFRHYADLDHWGTYPFDRLPRRRFDALRTHTELKAVIAGDTLSLLTDTTHIRRRGELRIFGPAVLRGWGRDTLRVADSSYRSFFFQQLYTEINANRTQFEVPTPPWLDFVPPPLAPLDGLFAEDHLTPYGVLPYHLPQVFKRLTEAFRDRQLDRILKLSADIGHYVGDAHVPLHTTENYNGQLTGQRGIHGLWESRLPETFADRYDYFVGRAYYIEDRVEAAWRWVLESHLRVDSVLDFERELSETFPADQKYGYENRNNVVTRAYSKPFSQAYHEMLNGMVESRMRASIRRLGSVWYTAWLDAGAPDLRPLLGDTPRYEPQNFSRELKILDREATDVQ